MLKGTVNKKIPVTALFKENVDGTIGAVCPEIPGCTVTGSNLRDANRKIKAAVKACLTRLLQSGLPRRSAGRH